MKRIFWQLLIVGLLIGIGIRLPSKVVGVDSSCTSCPYGCEQTGPSSWECLPNPNPAPPPPPPAVDCGDASAPSCNGSCSSGQSCVTTSANPNCHCKAGANGAPACSAGKSLKAYTPSGTLNNNQCTFPGMCWSFFPSKTINGCDPLEIKAQCSVSYLCCNANQGISCTTGANDTHNVMGSSYVASCPAGEMKVDAWVVVTPVENEEPIRMHWAKCLQPELKRHHQSPHCTPPPNHCSLITVHSPNCKILDFNRKSDILKI
jgi:hypothetical protein